MAALCCCTELPLTELAHAIHFRKIVYCDVFGRSVKRKTILSNITKIIGATRDKINITSVPGRNRTLKRGEFY